MPLPPAWTIKTVFNFALLTSGEQSFFLLKTRGPLFSVKLNPSRFLQVKVREWTGYHFLIIMSEAYMGD